MRRRLATLAAGALLSAAVLIAAPAERGYAQNAPAESATQTDSGQLDLGAQAVAPSRGSALLAEWPPAVRPDSPSDQAVRPARHTSVGAVSLSPFTGKEIVLAIVLAIAAVGMVLVLTSNRIHWPRRHF